MRGKQATKIAGSGSAARWALAGAAAAMAALLLAQPAEAKSTVKQKAAQAYRSIDRFDYDKGSLAIGAGGMAYIAQESPSTGFAMDLRYSYPILTITQVEGSVTGAVSQSVDNVSATLPVLIEGGLKWTTNRPGQINGFAGAGLGYGAYTGSKDLQDGLTMTMPLSAGLEFVTKNKKMAYEPRFTYRPVFGDELGDEEADADSWTAVLDVALPFL